MPDLRDFQQGAVSSPALVENVVEEPDAKMINALVKDLNFLSGAGCV